MNSAKLGDSYDIVKRTFLGWMSGQWSVHPMCTDAVPKVYKTLIAAKTVISWDVITRQPDVWHDFMTAAANCEGHLFLDPDTGVKTNPKYRTRSHILLTELRDLIRQRGTFLTAVFDQSIGNGFDQARRREFEAKLEELKEAGICSFGYFSHACFIVASQNQRLVQSARKRIIAQSGLSEERLPKRWV